MPLYERGHSGQEVGELRQRLADLGYEVSATYEYDEYTEEALRRFQVDHAGREGTGVADEETLTQLEYHHASYLEYQQQSEPPRPVSYTVSDDGQHWWDGNQWNPFLDPQVTSGAEKTTDDKGEHFFAGLVDVNDPDPSTHRGTGSRVTVLGAHFDVNDAGEKGDVAAFKTDLQTQNGLGMSFGALTASSEIKLGDQGYYGVGAQANLIEGSYGLGQNGNDESQNDVYFKAGASLGEGMAGRVYAGTDVDGDGVREYGLGADYSFLGGDLRVESQTLTDAHQAGSETYDEVAKEAGELYDEAADTLGKIISGDEPMPDVRN